jgi:hypothetical protein
LVKVPDFNAYVESEMNLRLVKLKNERDTLHAISHELWQIVVEVLVHHD